MSIYCSRSSRRKHFVSTRRQRDYAARKSATRNRVDDRRVKSPFKVTAACERAALSVVRLRFVEDCVLREVVGRERKVVVE